MLGAWPLKKTVRVFLFPEKRGPKNNPEKVGRELKFVWGCEKIRKGGGGCEKKEKLSERKIENAYKMGMLEMQLDNNKLNFA